jgi:hypothetical protein
MVPHPLEPLVQPPNGVAWLVLVFLAVLLVMPFASGPTRPGAPRHIVHLELARTRVKAHDIVQEWKDQGLLARARRTVLWDFAFIPAYTAALALACLLVAGAFGPRTVTAPALLRAAAWLPLLAGLFDVVENLALLRMLRSATAVSPWPQLAFACAAPKFVLVGLAAITLLVGAVAALVSRIGGTHAP